MEEVHKEMQLLSSSSHPPPPLPPPAWRPSNMEGPPPSLDLELSISVTTPFKRPSDRVLIRKVRDHHDEYNYDVKSSSSSSCVEALKWQAAEQIRLAAMEKAYAERVRELTRREMELAQSEFARARHMWERAREEVQRVEKLKERATPMNEIEITCHSCRQKFKP